MQEIKMVVELCADDRARLDKIIAGISARCEGCLGTVKDYMTAVEGKNATRDALEEEGKLFANLGEEVVPDEEIQSETKVAPTLEEIQKKVMDLCVGASKKRKAEVRGVINAYATKVSDLVKAGADLTEVWDKLTALEG